MALAGRVIASHYAEPVERVIASATALRARPADDGEMLEELSPGVRFLMLENSVGWAWGYAGTERRVGYVLSQSVAG